MTAPALPAGLDLYESSQYGNAIGICWEGTSQNDIAAIIAAYRLDAEGIRRTIRGAQRRHWPRRCQCKHCWPLGTMPPLKERPA